MHHGDARRIEMAEGVSVHGGTNFFRTDSSLRVSDIRILSTVEQSVGLVTIERTEEGRVLREWGTGFLVGNGYLMTAYHLFENKIDAMLEDIEWFMSEDDYKQWLQTYFPEEHDLSQLTAFRKHLEKQMTFSVDNLKKFMNKEDFDNLDARLKKKICDQCYVTFWKHDDKGETIEEKLFFFNSYIPFADKINDVIILEISLSKSSDSLPPSLQLDEEFALRDRVSLYGYIFHEGREKLHMDPECSVYVDEKKLDADMKKAYEWWLEKENRVDENGQYRKINIIEEYEQCSSAHNRQHGCVTLHASTKFGFGTSGSPLIFVKKVGNTRKPVVFGMYQRGYPSFYYKVKNSVNTGNPLPNELTHFNKFRDLIKSDDWIPLQTFFEAGVTMKHIAQVLQFAQSQNLQRLKQEIFEMPTQTAMKEGEASSKKPKTDTYSVMLDNMSKVSITNSQHQTEVNIILPKPSQRENNYREEWDKEEFLYQTSETDDYIDMYEDTADQYDEYLDAWENDEPLSVEEDFENYYDYSEM